MQMIKRLRRLRSQEGIRRMVRETRLTADALILPFFVREGREIREEILSLPGQVRYSPDTLWEGIEAAMEKGVNNFLLFGVPIEKDGEGSGAWAEDGVIQQSLRKAKEKCPGALLITDVCLCEYTDHGHCGVLENKKGKKDVDNDATLPLLARTALSHAQAGADIIAPSDMMDGRVAVIRSALDSHGYSNLPVMSYAAKYASAFYGPFREAAGSAPSFGDRKTYQMDFYNGREAVLEAALDIEEGADICIVKPALAYLDIVSAVKQTVNRPVAAYSVSGEYAMLKAAATANLLDEHRTMCESAVCIFRAGADILITYYAKELAAAIAKGDVG